MELVSPMIFISFFRNRNWIHEKKSAMGKSSIHPFPGRPVSTLVAGSPFATSYWTNQLLSWPGWYQKLVFVGNCSRYEDVNMQQKKTFFRLTYIVLVHIHDIYIYIFVHIMYTDM